MSKPDSLRLTRWNDFVRRSLGANTIAEYWFCPAKIYNKVKLGKVETPATIEGSQIHEEEAQYVLKKLGPLRQVKVETLFDAMVHSYRNLSLALKGRRILANSEGDVLFRCIVPEMGYIGLPDRADCQSDRQPIIIETKTTHRLPDDVWMDHRIQMGVYLIGLERLSFKPTHGVVEYLLRTDRSAKKRYEVNLDDNLRETIHATSRDVLDILHGKEPVPCNNPRKCASCGYREDCTWSLSKTQS